MIENIIRQITATNPASCDTGWLDDAQHYFCENKAWTVADAFIREDQSCLLELKALVSEDVKSLVALRSIQQAIWQDMAWPYFEASSVIFYKQASVLRFVTLNSKGAESLTGRMIVGGNSYSELASRSATTRKATRELPDAPFEVDFSDLRANRSSRTTAAEIIARLKIRDDETDKTSE